MFGFGVLYRMINPNGLYATSYPISYNSIGRRPYLYSYTMAWWYSYDIQSARSRESLVEYLLLITFSRNSTATPLVFYRMVRA
jgi:hypothetical protein